MDNRQVVLVHNILADQGMKSYRMGMTEFADMVSRDGSSSPSSCESQFPLGLLKNPLPLLRALSPAKRGVPAGDLSGLPGSLRCLQPPTGLHFLQDAGGKSTAHRRRLEEQGIRHPCEGSEAVWLLLGLQCCTFIASLLFLLAAAENSMVLSHLFFILFFLF